MIRNLQIAAVLCCLAAIPAHADDWNLFAAHDVAQTDSAWQLFGTPDPVVQEAPPSAAAAEWNLFAAKPAAKPAKDTRPVVVVECPVGDWCESCLCWKHDPRVDRSLWIETASLPFQLKFRPVDDKTHSAYPMFLIEERDGKTHKYPGLDRGELLSVWRQFSRDAAEQ